MAKGARSQVQEKPEVFYHGRLVDIALRRTPGAKATLYIGFDFQVGFQPGPDGAWVPYTGDPITAEVKIWWTNNNKEFADRDTERMGFYLDQETGKYHVDQRYYDEGVTLGMTEKVGESKTFFDWRIVEAGDQDPSEEEEKLFKAYWVNKAAAKAAGNAPPSPAAAASPTSPAVVPAPPTPTAGPIPSASQAQTPAAEPATATAPVSVAGGAGQPSDLDTDDSRQAPPPAPPTPAATPPPPTTPTPVPAAPSAWAATGPPPAATDVEAWTEFSSACDSCDANVSPEQAGTAWVEYLQTLFPSVAADSLTPEQYGVVKAGAQSWVMNKFDDGVPF